VGDFFSKAWKTFTKSPQIFIAAFVASMVTAIVMAPLVGAFADACAMSGAGTTFWEGFLIGGMEIGAPTFTGTLAANFAAGDNARQAFKGAGIAGGAAFITAGIIEGSYSADWQNRFHYRDTRIDEINAIKEAYARGDYARAHYLEEVVARKGISVSTAEKLGWPVPKRTFLDRIWLRSWEEPYTEGWKWVPGGSPFSGHMPSDAMLKMGVFPAVKIQWGNQIVYKGFETNFFFESYTRSWIYGGGKTTETWVSAAGYQYNPYESYPFKVSPWK
jgi:hypothetical protein